MEPASLLLSDGFSSVTVQVYLGIMLSVLYRLSAAVTPVVLYRPAVMPSSFSAGRRATRRTGTR